MPNNSSKRLSLKGKPKKQVNVPPVDMRQTTIHLIAGLRREVHKVIDIRHDADVEGTTEGIKSSMTFQGVNAWILAFSILIASIGLNTGSTAVIIGAMLISPLMGPILGVGLGVGTNDWPTLLKALKGFGIMVVISFTVAWLYFLISPMKQPTTEILNRTEPTPLDIVIALCGGFAGIIAGSRKVKSNVIPGVAIATALMPPLCVAGYGTAVGNLNIFAGASYLFLLNSFFISVSTFIIIKYLKFPVVHLLDPKRERRINNYIMIFALLIIIPSGLIFWRVINKTRFEQKANLFVEEQIRTMEGVYISDPKYIFDKGVGEIDIAVSTGGIDSIKRSALVSLLPDYGLKGVELKIHQLTIDDIKNREQSILTEEQHKRQQLDLAYKQQLDVKDSVIKAQEAKLKLIQTKRMELLADTMPLVKIGNQLRIMYPIERINYSPQISVGENMSQDTTDAFSIHWKSTASRRQIRKSSEEIIQYLKIELSLDTLAIISY